MEKIRVSTFALHAVRYDDAIAAAYRRYVWGTRNGHQANLETHRGHSKRADYS